MGAEVWLWAVLLLSTSSASKDEAIRFSLSAAPKGIGELTGPWLEGVPRSQLNFIARGDDCHWWLDLGDCARRGGKCQVCGRGDVPGCAELCVDCPIACPPQFVARGYKKRAVLGWGKVHFVSKGACARVWWDAPCGRCLSSPPLHFLPPFETRYVNTSCPEEKSGKADVCDCPLQNLPQVCQWPAFAKAYPDRCRPFLTTTTTTVRTNEVVHDVPILPVLPTRRRAKTTSSSSTTTTKTSSTTETPSTTTTITTSSTTQTPSTTTTTKTSSTTQTTTSTAKSATTRFARSPIATTGSTKAIAGATNVTEAAVTLMPGGLESSAFNATSAANTPTTPSTMTTTSTAFAPSTSSASNATTIADSTTQSTAATTTAASKTVTSTNATTSSTKTTGTTANQNATVSVVGATNDTSASTPAIVVVGGAETHLFNTTSATSISSTTSATDITSTTSASSTTGATNVSNTASTTSAAKASKASSGAHQSADLIGPWLEGEENVSVSILAHNKICLWQLHLSDCTRQNGTCQACGTGKGSEDAEDCDQLCLPCPVACPPSEPLNNSSHPIHNSEPIHSSSQPWKSGVEAAKLRLVWWKTGEEDCVRLWWNLPCGHCLPSSPLHIRAPSSSSSSFSSLPKHLSGNFTCADEERVEATKEPDCACPPDQLRRACRWRAFAEAFAERCESIAASTEDDPVNDILGGGSRTEVIYANRTLNASNTTLDHKEIQWSNADQIDVKNVASEEASVTFWLSRFWWALVIAILLLILLLIILAITLIYCLQDDQPLAAPPTVAETPGATAELSQLTPPPVAWGAGYSTPRRIVPIPPREESESESDIAVDPPPLLPLPGASRSRSPAIHQSPMAPRSSWVSSSHRTSRSSVTSRSGSLRTLPSSRRSRSRSPRAPRGRSRSRTPRLSRSQSLQAPPLHLSQSLSAGKRRGRFKPPYPESQLIAYRPPYPRETEDAAVSVDLDLPTSAIASLTFDPTNDSPYHYYH